MDKARSMLQENPNLVYREGFPFFTSDIQTGSSFVDNGWNKKKNKTFQKQAKQLLREIRLQLREDCCIHRNST